MCKLLNAFKQTPSQATNFVKQVKIKLRICPILNKEAVLKFFFAQCKDYGFEKTEIAPNTVGIYYENKANETERRRNDLVSTK